MRALKIVIYDSKSQKTREERYSRSPVMIGRHPRNDLCLSFGFVSGSHAKIEFDEHGGTFVDVGSTNGSSIGGRKLQANHPVPIGDGLSVTVGKLEIRIGWHESSATSGVYERDPQGAVVTRAPRLPTMPIQAVSEGPAQAPALTQQQQQQARAEGPPSLGGPPLVDTGPPSLGSGPPRLDGPPALDGGGGPPALDGPPQLGGPPSLDSGPPQLGGPPSLDSGPPQLGGQPPSLDSGPPQLGGPPSLDSGPPSLGGPPSLDSGPPQLGTAPPALDGGPPQLGAEPEPPKRKSGAEATGFVDLGGVHRAIREVRPAYEQYAAARKSFEGVVEQALSKIPANTRDTAMAFLRREFPDMPGSKAMIVAPTGEGAVPEASSTVTNFAAHVLSTVTPPGNADEQSAFLSRIAEILQTTAQAFIEIRNVQARFGEEMGVRTIREYTPLHAATDARAVLDYLLDWRAGPERNAQLSAVYSDFMLHQVALINGVVEGVQAMMDQFRPAEIERGVGGLSKAAGAWKKYTERYSEEIEERGIASLVFGPEFARAYSEVGQG